MIMSSAAHQSLANNIYATPPTFMEMLVECSQFIEKARHDPTNTKEDVLDSMENRLSLLVGKLASHPTCSTFRVELSDDTPAKD